MDVNFSFAELVPEVAPLVIVDVGARQLQTVEAYQALVDMGRAYVIGFEPDEVACAKLNETARPPSRFHAACIGDGSAATLYETAFPNASSLYVPNQRLASRFSALPSFVAVRKTTPVNTKRLDDIITEASIDYLKMDVQGAELDVLKGAPRLLKTALAIRTEVEFIPLYVDQPLFADIDIYLRGQGFQLHILTEPNKLCYAPMMIPGKPLQGITQTAWADAIYIPDVTRLLDYPKEQLLKLVMILHDFHKSVDLCIHILHEMRISGLDVPLDRYKARLGIK
ncbi:MAG: FkbM family methyltransferase [Rhodospirillaceae bacterium]|nr:FkbM family methyltransferase [Rhodospirillaceae bacterium]